MTETAYSIVVDGVVHTYYDLEQAADAWVAFRTNCCSTSVSTSNKDVHKRANEKLRGD